MYCTIHVGKEWNCHRKRNWCMQKQRNRSYHLAEVVGDLWMEQNVEERRKPIR